MKVTCDLGMRRKHGYISDFLEKYLSRVLNNHQLAFIHAGLQRNNILLRRLPLKHENVDRTWRSMPRSKQNG